MNIVRLLMEQAEVRGSAAAIIDRRRGRDRVLTFAGLEAASARLAARLRKTGLRPGDTVLLMQPMSPELYVALAAIWRVGLIAMFLDPWLPRSVMEESCRRQPPQALITAPIGYLLRLLIRAIGEIPIRLSTGMAVPGALSWSAAGRLDPDPEIEDRPNDAPALITFTSGSTGAPKAAVRTHGLLAAQHRALANALALQPGEVDLCTLPIVLLSNLASGVASLIPAGRLGRPGAIDPGPIADQIERFQPASVAASPALLARLHAARTGKPFPSFQKVFSGGAPVFPALLDRFSQLAPNAEIVAVYGSTEAEPIAHLSRDSISDEDRQAMRIGAGLLAGRPVPEVEVRILRDRWGASVGPWNRHEFALESLLPRQAGEIVVTGDHVLAGAVHGHGTAETGFQVDDHPWHRTGDAGYLDERGRLWLLGRASARIQDDRGILYPFSVECAVHEVRGLSRSALVHHRGERVLVVELDRPADLEEVRRNLSWAPIDRVIRLPRIPVDGRHNAKVDYPALQQLLQ